MLNDSAHARPRLICGAVAQLVERMNGIHEVVGSTPIGSTKPSACVVTDAGVWRLGGVTLPVRVGEMVGFDEGNH